MKDVGKKQIILNYHGYNHFKFQTQTALGLKYCKEAWKSSNDLFEFKIESAFEIWNRDSRRNEDVSDTIHEVTTRQPSRVIYDCGKN